MRLEIPVLKRGSLSTRLLPQFRFVEFRGAVRALFPEFPTRSKGREDGAFLKSAMQHYYLLPPT
jgi:hypothetical protein